MKSIRKTSILLASAAFLCTTAPAEAVSYIWSGGNYVSGTTSPNPLLAPDILSITTGANKLFTGGTFTNQSGTVDWQAGAIFLSNGMVVNNQSLWDATGNNSLNYNGGAAVSFLNSGIFRKSGGVGTTAIGAVGFVNSGVIDAQTGIISFNGGDAVFNAGGSFTGAGIVSINSNATFQGAQTSSNLSFDGGTYTGNAASLTGSANWTNGSFNGGWTVTAGSTLNAVTGANKLIVGGTTTNQGVFSWQAGSIFLSNGSVVDNQGLWEATGNNSISYNGGAATGFTNSGTFRKSGGGGTTSIGAVGFVNSGVIDAQSGTISFGGGDATFNAGSSFVGGGVVAISSNAAFNGAFTSANVDFTAGTFTGTGAALSGSADWLGGSFTGDWTVAANVTLTTVGGANKLLTGGSFTNNGTIDWQGGSLFLSNGTQLTNNGTLAYAVSSSLNTNGGAASTITNSASGVIEVDAGATVTMNNSFVNNGGTLTANGIFNFNHGTAVFNDNSVFNGAGTNAINSDAAFNGDIDSANLRFNGGTFTGGNAVLSGDAAWAAGAFTGTWTVAAGSTLTTVTGANKAWNGATFTNEGTIDWQGGASFLANGTQLINNGVIDFAASSSLNSNGGAVSTITNGASGLIRVAAGQTVSVNNPFVNNGGTLTANGTLNFNHGTAIFNAGTVFDGAGTNAINSNATFAGASSSTNLRFAGGVYTGVGAVLNGTASWRGDTFTGGWIIASGATLTVDTGSNKLMSAAVFDNQGSIDWTGGALFLSDGTQLTNSGAIDYQVDTSVNNNGGAVSSFTNNGLIEKTGGAGTTSLANGVAFDNNGTINVLSGTIALPGAFTNDGTLGGTGSFASANLTNAGSIAPGAAGSVGTLALAGNFAQAASGTLRTQLASSASADLFNISGSAALGGTLALSCILGCAINDGDSFVILDSIGALSGTFASVTTTGFLNGFSYDVIYDYAADRVLLSVLDAGTAPAVPEPANWAMMIAGFALAGSAARRRQRTVVLA